MYVFILDGDFASCMNIVREELTPFYSGMLGLRCTFKISASIDNLVKAVEEEKDNDIIFIYPLNGASRMELIGKLLEWLETPPTIRVFEVSSCSGGLCYTVIDPMVGYEEWLKRQD